MSSISRRRSGAAGNRSQFWDFVPALLVAAVVTVVLVVAVDSGDLTGTTSSPPPTNVTECGKTDRNVSDPSAPHGLFVLSPPTEPTQPYYAASVQLLETNPAVCGADFFVHWSVVDQGPGSTPEYNWTSVTDEIAPWIAAGKEVNLIFQTVGYGPNQSWIPSYVLPQINTIQCGDSPLTPLFWQAPYTELYQTYIRAAVDHFETVPGIGYIRVGLGTGGETFPLYDVGAPGCEAALNATGFTTTIWTHYLLGMLQFEQSLSSPVQLMVALNDVFPGIPDNVSARVATSAVQDGIGFGSEGLEESMVEENATGAPVCGGEYCQLFNEYAGKVPLEFQTATASEPNGSGPTGSLTTLIPWALAMHTQIFELYFVDWLTAFDPSYPAYAMYHAAYAATLQSAADNVDGE
jgi:hypothetical protein